MPGSTHIFFDESGTSAGDQFTLVCATVFADVEAAESLVASAFHRAQGNIALWPNDVRRSQFAATGYHFAEDSETVRATLLDAIAQLDFRAYAVFGMNTGQETTDRLVHMYGLLLRSLIPRYRGVSPAYVFEQNSSMNGLYGQLLDYAHSETSTTPVGAAFIGDKRAPCLAVTDYVLGVTRQHLVANPPDFQERRFAALGSKFAYLVDYDDDRHYGGRKRPIL